MNFAAARYRLGKLHRSLHLEAQPLVGSRVTARVHNGYIFPLNCVYAYITISHEESDVLQPPNNFKAYVTPAHLCKVQDDRLCWSIYPNPPFVDIYPGERQALNVVNIELGRVSVGERMGDGGRDIPSFSQGKEVPRDD